MNASSYVLQLFFCAVQCSKSPDLTVTKNTGEKQHKFPLVSYKFTMFFLIVNALCKKFNVIPCITSKDLSILVYLKNVQQKYHLLNDRQKNLIRSSLKQSATKCKIPLNSVHQYLNQQPHKNCIAQIQTDIFQKQPNYVQNIPRRINSAKIGNRKNLQDFSTFIFCIQIKVRKLVFQKYRFQISMFLYLLGCCKSISL